MELHNIVRENSKILEQAAVSTIFPFKTCFLPLQCCSRLFIVKGELLQMGLLQVAQALDTLHLHPS